MRPIEDGHAMSTRRSHRRSESGNALVWTTIFLFVLLGCAALAFDISNMINVRDELGNAVDGAAVGAAQALQDGGTNEAHVRLAAQRLAAANPLPSLDKNKTGSTVTLNSNSTNAGGGDIVLGNYDFTTATFTRAGTPIDLSTVNAAQVNARLSTAARVLPLAFAPMLGFKSFDTVRTAMAVLGARSKLQPNAPVVVNRDVFNGKTKGILPPDDIYLSTKSLNDMAWTGFFGSTSASNVKNYADNQPSIPALKVGDVINITTANQTVDYHEMKVVFPVGSLMLVPVVIFDAGITRGTVVGFTTIRVDLVVDTGDPKFIDGTLVKNTTGSTHADAGADCFGTDCRSFLVN